MTDLIKRDDALNACILREDNPPTEMQLSLRNVISALPAVDRIEELVKERDDYAHKLMASNNTYTEMHVEIARLSDKLTKAVDVIKCILASTYANDHVGYHVALYGAKALLAELRGGK